MDPFERMAFGGGFVMALTMIPFLLLGLAIPYAVLRLRDAHSPKPDPQLGYRTALHFFFSGSLLLLMLGLTISSVDLVMRLRLGGRANMLNPNEPWFNTPQRNALALVLSGGLFSLVNFLPLLFLPPEKVNVPVRRTFLGWRFAIHGMVIVPCITGIIMLLLQRPDPMQRVEPSDMFQVLVGVLLIWLPSWFIHFMLLRRASTPFQPEDRPFHLRDEDEDEDDDRRRRRRIRDDD